MLFITEQLEDLHYITELEGNDKKHYIQGVFAQAEIANKNKRIYPIAVLENEVGRYRRENINKNNAYGELGHPTGPNINLDRVAIHVKSLVQEGNDFIGKALIASTPMGGIVKGLISDGAKLGVSTRALGSLKPTQNGLNEVQGDLRLLAVDVVADPSAPRAFVDGIMEETSYFWDSAKQAYIQEHADNTRRGIRGMTSREVEEKQVRMFADFLNRLGDYYQ